MIELVIRVVFSLSVILGLLWFVARASNKRFGGAARSMVRVVARQPLARSASLAVIEVGERVLVVGVSEHGVALLTEMDPSELPVEATVPTEDVAGSVRNPGFLPVKPAFGTERRAGEGLTGSVLSTQTWRQAWAAATSRGGGRGD